MNNAVAGKAIPLMRVQDLAFSHDRLTLFDGWSGSFGAGVSLLRGRNGAGKSTLLRLLAGATPPRSGRLWAAGQELAKSPFDYRQQVFWCGPGPVPFDHLTPVEYWRFMKGLYPSMQSPCLDEHIAGFQLAPHLHKPLSALSTGTQRKVWLAMSLACGTPVTLLDEPLNALDVASLSHLREALARHSRDSERAWIVCSHEDLGEHTEIRQVVDLSGVSQLDSGPASLAPKSVVPEHR